MYTMLKETKFESPLINKGKECDRCGAKYQITIFKCKFCGKSLIIPEKQEKTYGKYSNKNRRS